MKTLSTQDIQGLLNGDILRSGWLRRQYKLLSLIAVLVFIYILGGYHATEQHHRLSDLKAEVRDAKFEYLTVSAQRAEATRQSNIIKMLEEKNSLLQPNRKPLIMINE